MIADRESRYAPPPNRGQGTMTRLHGTTSSTHAAVVCTALHEKGLPFEFVPGASGTVLRLETEAGEHSELRAILDHLEQIAPEPALMPAGPAARDRILALSQRIESDLAQPARRLAEAGASDAGAPAEPRAEVAAELEAGILAVRALARFEPWVAGERFTQADLVWHFTLELVDRVGREALDGDLLAGVPAAAAHREALEARPSVQRWRGLS